MLSSFRLHSSPNCNVRAVSRVLCAIALIIAIRVFVCEVYMVDTPSMIPALQPTEIYSVDKLSHGSLMPVRFAEIPIVNVFTWIRLLRELDERNCWRYCRVPGFRDIREGDVILFHSKADRSQVLVKRVTGIFHRNGHAHYYVLGDNACHSVDSRHFGLIPDSLVIGRARHVLFSWDSEARGFAKVRWRRIGHDISRSQRTAPLSRTAR